MSDSFFQRWSKRKSELAQQALEEKAQEKNTQTNAQIPEQKNIQDVSDSFNLQGDDSHGNEVANQGPTLEDVEKLTRDSDYSLFVSKDIDPAVQQAAMKKLFSDPHFNVMDGLDIYIDDYSKPDPLPVGMLEKLVQSSMLGLFKAKTEEKIEELGKSLANDSFPKEPESPKKQDVDLDLKINSQEFPLVEDKLSHSDNKNQK